METPKHKSEDKGITRRTALGMAGGAVVSAGLSQLPGSTWKEVGDIAEGVYTSANEAIRPDAYAIENLIKLLRETGQIEKAQEFEENQDAYIALLENTSKGLGSYRQYILKKTTINEEDTTDDKRFAADNIVVTLNKINYAAYFIRDMQQLMSKKFETTGSISVRLSPIDNHEITSFADKYPAAYSDFFRVLAENSEYTKTLAESIYDEHDDTVGDIDAGGGARQEMDRRHDIRNIQSRIEEVLNLLAD